MAATGDTAIPPRLSELQQFILAHIENNSSGPWPAVYRDAVQNAVLDEFGEYRRETPLGDRWNKKPITAAGSSALSRSLARLEERGLIEGERVAAELLRRCSDGRYSLAFETL